MNEIEKYIKEKYDVLIESPWEKYPEFVTYKHKDSKKWFALIMKIPYSKLNIEKEGMTYVINLKSIPDMIGSLRTINGIFAAYHMNKEHWITVLLDGTVQVEHIFNLIDISYELTSRK